MKTKAIKLADISIDGGTQQREKIDHAIVEEYAEAMRCGAKFPPVTLFHDGAQYWLADGFHRFHASNSAEMLDILADVHDGLCRDAVLFSAGANGAHGIRLTNADKRKAVMILLADKEWSAWADAAIARHCKVTHPFVGKLRSEMAPKSPSLPVTVTGDALKPAPVLEVENQKTGAEVEQEDPEYTELDAAKDQISDLQDALVVATLAPEDKQISVELIAGLRSEIKTLTATLDAVKASRDTYQNENAQLKKQVQRQRKEIDKLTGKKTA